MDDQKKEKLINYVNEQIAAGNTIDILTGQLKELGWSPDEIDEVFTAADINTDQTKEAESAAEPTPNVPHEAITTPQKEVNAAAAGNDTKSSGSKFFVSVIVILLFAGVGAAAGMVMAGWSPSMLFSSPPSIHDVIDAHRSVESFTYDVELTSLTEFSSDAANQQQLMSTLMFVPGALDDGEIPDSITAELGVAGNVSLMESTDTQTNIRIGLGAEIVEDLLAIEYRRVADENYVRGTVLPDLGLINLKPMEGEWLSLGGVIDGAGSTFGASSDVAEAASSDESVLDQVSPETHDQLRQAILEEEVFTIKSDGKSQLDDGTDVYKFSISIDPDSMLIYIERVDQIIEENEPHLIGTPMYTSLQDSLMQMVEYIDKLNLQDDQIQIWVDQETYLIRRLQTTALLSRQQLADLNTDGVESSSIELLLNFSNYNEPVQVDVPTDVKTFEEAQQIIMSAQSSMDTTFTQNHTGVVENSANSARADSYNARRQSDIAQIRTALELYRNDNGSYDTGLTSADGRDEQQAVLGVYMDQFPADPSADEAYGADYVVETSADGYCISAPAYDGMDFPSNNTDCSTFNYSIGPGV